MVDDREFAETRDGNEGRNEPGIRRFVLRLIILAGTSVVLANQVGLRGNMALEQSVLIRIQQVADRSFLANDVFASNAEYYGRKAWVHVLALANQLVSDETLLLGLYLLTIFIALAGMYHLALALGKGNDLVALLAISLLALYPHTFLLGRSAVFGQHYYANWLSSAVLLFSLSFAVRRRPVAALAIAGLATNIHLLQGAQIATLLACYFGWLLLRAPAPRRKHLAAFATGLIAYTCLAAPELWHGVRTVLFPPNAPPAPISSRDIVEIVGHLRTGHHFLPIKYALTHYWGTAAVLWLGLAGACWCHRVRACRNAALLIGLIVLICALLAPFIELHYRVMLLHVFRMMKFAWALAIGLLAALAVEAIARRSVALTILAAGMVLLWHIPTLCVAAACLLLVGLALRSAENRKRTLLCAATGVLLVAASLTFLDPARDVFRWQQAFNSGTPAIYAAWLLTALAALVVGVRSGVARVVYGTAAVVAIAALVWLVVDPISYARPHRHQTLFDWIRRNTPEHEVIVVHPSELIGFRSRARRAVFAEMRLTPFEAHRVAEWYHRLNLLSRGELARRRPELVARRWATARDTVRQILRRNYAALSADELRQIARTYDLHYAVMPAKVSLDLPVLYRDENQQVLQLQPLPEGVETDATRPSARTERPE